MNDTATPDLFTSYPDKPGWKEPTTSADAAPSRSEASLMRGKVLRVYEGMTHATPDEVADHLGLSVLSVRPRCSELIAMGKLERTSIRIANRSGKTAAALRRVRA